MIIRWENFLHSNENTVAWNISAVSLDSSEENTLVRCFLAFIYRNEWTERRHIQAFPRIRFSSSRISTMFAHMFPFPPGKACFLTPALLSSIGLGLLSLRRNSQIKIHNFSQKFSKMKHPCDLNSRKPILLFRYGTLLVYLRLWDLRRYNLLLIFKDNIVGGKSRKSTWNVYLKRINLILIWILCISD